MPHNKSKKFLALLLAALFVFSSFSTAFAAQESSAGESVEQAPAETPTPWKSVEQDSTQTPIPTALTGEATPVPTPTAEAAPESTPASTPGEWKSVEQDLTETPAEEPTASPSPAPTSSIQGTAQAIKGLQAGEDYAPNELLFFAESEREAKRVAEAYGGKLKTFTKDFAVVSFAETDKSINQALLESEQQTNARSALPELIPNYVRTAYSVDTSAIAKELQQPAAAGEAMAAPSDPWYSQQGFHKVIGSEYAWDAGTAGQGVVVAVLDSGIDPTHPDLTPNLKEYVNTNRDALILDDDDGTGNTKPYDNQGHGTHVAGIIAAAANNGILGCGVAHQAKIMSVKVLELNDKGGASGYDTDIMAGVRYAIDNGADIINMSLGGYGSSSAYQNILTEAANKGILVFAAAGNDSVSLKTYPAAYDNVISVGALNDDDSKASFSNYGDWVDISAPGVNLLSTYSRYCPDGKGKSHPLYIWMAGTSQATPVVAGVAALMLSKSATLKGLSGKDRVTTVEKLLKKNAAAISATNMGAGRVDVSKVFHAIDDQYVYEGIDYSPVFDYAYYRNRYPDIEAAFGDDAQAGFFHFIAFGIAERRQACATFNVDIYMKNYYSEMAATIGNTPKSFVWHYCVIGCHEPHRNATTLIAPSYVYDGIDYAPVFDYAYYRNRYPDIEAAFGDDAQAGFMYFINEGIAKKQQACATFNVDIYMKNYYSEMAATIGNTPGSFVWHYCVIGCHEPHRNATTLIAPSYVYDGIDYAPVFDYAYYRNRYPDIEAAFGDDAQAGFMYFINEGIAKKQQACATFSVDIYMKNYYSEMASIIGNTPGSFVWHYCVIGCHEPHRNATTLIAPSYVYGGIDYSPVFDYAYYRNRYPDIEAAFGDDAQAGFMYFINEGIAKKQQACATFSVDIYMKNYFSEMAPFIGNTPESFIWHYCVIGCHEPHRNATTLI